MQPAAVSWEVGVRWFQALLPREDRFFAYFIEHAQLLLQAAEALRALLAGGEGVPEACAAIMRYEDDADQVTRKVMLAVRRTLITPFDRSDIRDLAASLDDAIDQMQKTAKSITLFEMRQFESEMRELGDLAIQAAYLTLEAVELLHDLGKNAARLNGIAEAVTRIESRSDEVYDAGMKALFRKSQDRPMDFIAGADVYDHLEKVIDRFEDVANGISGILLEHL
jgi:predicted phosphate transport protein (TIGR00153 family)